MMADILIISQRDLLLHNVIHEREIDRERERERVIDWTRARISRSALRQDERTFHLLHTLDIE